MKSKQPVIKYREAWLSEAVGLMSPLFKRLNKQIPESLRVSCGFPTKNPLGAGRRAIGECWPNVASVDKTHELFVSPTIDEPIEVLGVLIHEVVHAVVGVDQKHKGMFKVVATSLGLEGKMTATTVGERLKPELEAIHKKLGDYPHKKLDKLVKEKEAKPSSVVKVTCTNCEYKFTLSKKLYEEYGLPAECVCGSELKAGE